MKKKILSVVLMSCAMFMAGCSKEWTEDVSWKDGGVSIGEETLELTQYTGSTAMLELPGIGRIDYVICEQGPDNCPHNALGVTVDTMPSYKKCSYYTTNLDSQVCLYMKKGDHYIEGLLNMDDAGLMSVNQAVEKLYTTMTPMDLSTTIPSIKLSDEITFLTGEYEWSAREHELVVPGAIRIGADDGTVKCDSTATIGESTVAYKSGTNYDYYQYGGYIIQIMKGLNINEYITIKEAK